MHAQIILETLCAAERSCADLMLEADDILTRNKGSARNLVTQYDMKIQSCLTSYLSEAFPSAHFYCEESETPESLDAEEVFMIDPIDGTMNFVHALRQSCISVAYLKERVAIVGAVYNPYADELFTAIRGEGTRLNGTPIHATDYRLSESLVAVGTAPYNPELSDVTLHLLRTALLNSLDIRRMGSAALDLCSVAAGRCGLFCEPLLSPWDYAAGALIAEEAGAVCRTLNGSPLPYDGSKPSVIAGGPHTVEDFFLLYDKSEKGKEP